MTFADVAMTCDDVSFEWAYKLERTGFEYEYDRETEFVFIVQGYIFAFVTEVFIANSKNHCQKFLQRLEIVVFNYFPDPTY